jgi:hypothetical protein
MTYAELIAYFGTQEKAAEGIGRDQSTISDWKTADRIPAPSQILVELKTNGSLKADPGSLESAIRFKPRQPKKPKRRATEQQGA